MDIDATTVWAVRLGMGPEDVQGTLSLEPPDLRFLADREDLRIPLDSITKVRRIRGSAVLVVEHLDRDGRRCGYAFFFVKPPPLVPEPGTSKRKLKRRSIVYLQIHGRERRDLLRAWVRAIRSRARRERAAT